MQVVSEYQLSVADSVVINIQDESDDPGKNILLSWTHQVSPCLVSLAVTSAMPDSAITPLCSHSLYLLLHFPLVFSFTFFLSSLFIHLLFLVLSFPFFHHHFYFFVSFPLLYFCFFSFFHLFHFTFFLFFHCFPSFFSHLLSLFLHIMSLFTFFSIFFVLILCPYFITLPIFFLSLPPSTSVISGSFTTGLRSFLIAQSLPSFLISLVQNS